MLFVLAWVFWLLRWGPAFLVVTFVAWLILHRRIEAGLGDVLRRQWRRAWPPGLPVLIALLVASALTFVLYDAPTTAKVLPVALDVLALSMVLFGHWWTRFRLPRWLGGDGPSPLLSSRASDAIGVDALPMNRLAGPEALAHAGAARRRLVAPPASDRSGRPD